MKHDTNKLNNDRINMVLRFIKDKIGMELALCDHFVGIQVNQGREYFNVVLNQRGHNSPEYLALARFADKYGLIQISPNGIQRFAIFPDWERIKHMNDRHLEFQQHPTKITLVVIDEYALACMFPESNRAQVISASVAFGSSYRDGDIVVVRANNRILRKVRIATQRDFDEFRVARSNYMGREHEYHFIIENNEDAT